MSLQASPFYARVMDANRCNAWENRGGFTLAADYGNVAEEAVAARFGAVMADVSWLWRVELCGEASPKLVARLFSRDASALAIGAAMDVLWLNDSGAVRGQGTVFRLSAERFLLQSAVEDAAWIEFAARLYGVAVRTRTTAEGVLSVIGPSAGNVLAAAGLPADQPPSSLRYIDWRGLGIALCRLGLGFEIVCQAEDARIVWDRIATAGRLYALLPAGQQALDILETESGILRPGRDYRPAREGFVATPLPWDLGLSPLVDRAHLFNGRAGVLAAGADTMLAGVLLEGAVAEGAPLLYGAETVGRILLCRHSPALQQTMALAVVPEALPEGLLSAGGIAARAASLPFLPIPAATESVTGAVEVLMSNAAPIGPGNGV